MLFLFRYLKKLLSDLVRLTAAFHSLKITENCPHEQSSCLGEIFPRLFLHFIPFDFVRCHLQFKRRSVAAIDHRGLRRVGVVDHAVFAVLHIGMDFHVWIRGEPAMQLVFGVCAPEYGAIQEPAVGKLYGRPEIYTARPASNRLPPAEPLDPADRGLSYRAARRCSSFLRQSQSARCSPR